MPLLIEITDGIQKGEKFKIADGITLGRKRANIIIKDPNVSLLHAKVLLDEDNTPVLVDQNSRNGLILNQQVVRKISLIPDIEFIVGDTPCKVIFKSDWELELLFPTKSWEELLFDYVGEHSPKVSEPEPISVFNPIIQLNFIQGIQFEQSYKLGFGPRTLGLYSLDLPLYEVGAPELAVKFVPEGNSAKIINYSFDKVLLNNKPFESEILKENDRLKIFTTMIEFKYINK